MKHYPTPKSTVDYMRKHKQGMFSSADKKLVLDNTPKSKALHKKSYSGHYQMNKSGAVRQLSQKTAEKKGMTFGSPYGIKELNNIQSKDYNKKHGKKFTSHYMSHTREK